MSRRGKARRKRGAPRAATRRSGFRRRGLAKGRVAVAEQREGAGAVRTGAVHAAAIELEGEEAEAVEKDRRMVECLAGIHNDLGVHADMKRADVEYAAAFRGYGVDVDAMGPHEAGARLAKSPFAAELANALEPVGFHSQLAVARRERRTTADRRRQGRGPRPMAEPTS